jgi:hypothetical protein
MIGQPARPINISSETTLPYPEENRSKSKPPLIRSAHASHSHNYR